MYKDVGSLHRVLSALLVIFALLIAKTAVAEPLLYDVRYNPLLKGETELQLVFDEELTQQPSIQVFNSPARIEMLFTNAQLDQGLADVAVNLAGINNVTSVMTSNGLKVTVHLERLKIYETQVNNNLVSLRISDNPLTEQALTTDDAADSIGGSYINRINLLIFAVVKRAKLKYWYFCKILKPQ